MTWERPRYWFEAFRLVRRRWGWYSSVDGLGMPRGPVFIFQASTEARKVNI